MHNKIIDFHTHAFPDRIAAGALEALSKTSGSVVPQFDGTAGGLTAYAEENGIDHCVVLNIATNEKQQRNVNDFAISVNKGRIISFGSVYPYSESAFEELDRIKAMGLKGIKLHPDYQEFFVDDERLFPLYSHIAKLGLITVFHAGHDIGIFEPVHCSPERLAAILPYFGGVPVVAAHFGGYLQWYAVEEYLIGRDVYLDTAYSYSKMPYLHAKRIVEKHGADKILLGSDLPWCNTVDEIKFVDALGLSDTNRAKVLYENAARLLKI